MRKTCLIVGVLCLCVSLPARAGRIIATPFSETLPQGRFQIWAVGLRENRSTDKWRTLQRLDVGITNRLELGIFTFQPPGKRGDAWLNVQFRLNDERKSLPLFAVGVWDATNVDKFSGQKTGGSFWLTASKTLPLRLGDEKTGRVKLNLGWGTNRLNGLFGGAVIPLSSRTGVQIEYTPRNLRLPNTDEVDVGVYHWLGKNWRMRVSRMGGNPMVDVFFTAKIGG